MLQMDLRGKKALIVGIGDDHGFGWSIAKALSEAGATLIVATWAPLYRIFTTSLKNGKFDTRLSDGSEMEFFKVYPIDATFDTPEDIPQEIREHKRYKDLSNYSIQEMADCIQKEVGSIDFLIHSLANAPEVQKPLLETSRQGYLAALSSSSYSLISLLKSFAPLIQEGGSVLSLSYIASERVVPGYGGGMSSAKAALESDTRTLAYEVGRKWGFRVNAISAGAYPSRAAKAIGMIDDMIRYAKANAPLSRDLLGEDVAKAALFLLSSWASAITGEVLFVDNGMHAMGLALDSHSLQKEEVATLSTS